MTADGPACGPEVSGPGRGLPVRAGAGLRRRRLARACRWARRCALHRPARSGRRPRPSRRCVDARAGRPSVVGAARGLAGGPPRRCAAVDPRRRWPTGRTAQRALVPALVDGDDAGVPERRCRRLPDHRADPPAGGVRHQPDAGRRLPAGGRPAGAACGVAGWHCVGRRRDRRLRAAGAHRAERGPGRRDGHGRRWSGSARDGRHRGLRGARRRRRRAAAARPGAGRLGRVRAVGPGHRRHPAARPAVARRAGPLAAAVAGRGGRGPAGGPAGLHAGGRGDLRPGQPGRGRRQPAGRRRWSRRRRCSGCSGGLVGLVAGRSAGCSARSRAGASAWIVDVAQHGAALPLRGGRLGDRRAGRWRCSPLVDRRGGRVPARCCCGTVHRRRRVPAAARRRRLVRPADAGLAAARVGASRPATSARATRWSCAPGRAAPWSSTPARTRAPSTAASTGSASSACRCWCSPTSTPTTSTALAGVLDGRTRRRGGGDPAGRPAGRRRRCSTPRRPMPVSRPCVAPYGETRHGRRRHPPGALAAAGLADRGPGDGARPTTPAWCCWPRSAASGCCSPATSSRAARPRWRGPARAAGRRAQGAAPRQPLPGPRLARSLGAAVALVSAGADNDYGHPAPEPRRADRARHRGAAHRPRRRRRGRRSRRRAARRHR